MTLSPKILMISSYSLHYLVNGQLSSDKIIYKRIIKSILNVLLGRFLEDLIKKLIYEFLLPLINTSS